MIENIREKQWYKYLKLILVFIPLLALLIQLLILMISSFNSEINSIIEKTLTLIMPIGIALLVYFIGKTLDEYFADIERLKEQRNLESKIDKIISFYNYCSSNTSKINEISSKILEKQTKIESAIYSISHVTIEILKTQNTFYERLKNTRLNAKEKVMLTQLDPIPPKDYGDQTRQNYFSSDIDYAKNHPDVQIRRILSIETQSKLEWVKDLVEATKDLPNFSLAYINIKDINKDVPFPKMLSLQIIDEEEVFILNPQFSFMPYDYENCYYIKNVEIAKIYCSYYNAIWNKIKDDDDPAKTGCILKSGTNLNDLEKVLSYINAHTRKDSK
jgi:hypothetical protein